VEKASDNELKPLFLPENKEKLDKFLYGRDLLDLALQLSSKGWEPQEFVSQLRKLQPRLYSISSSPKAHPGEVHVTVGVLGYECHGRKRKGVCSNYLAAQNVSSEVKVFIQKSHGFRLPENPATPIIMVGPGTGIAPFRAFIEERAATAASGKSWLFFGDQQKSSDFLYQAELLVYLEKGFLTRLDAAFSRDQKEKIYVQNRMLENAPLLFQWLEEGAHFYVCGDAKRMAKDVDDALKKIIQTEGGKSPEEATAYIENLKALKRYQRDVY
jgi:sulfite reductase (NADPH) flavoprotein alpha-component